MSNIKLTFNTKSTSYTKTVKKLTRKLSVHKSERNKYFLVVEIEKDDVDKDFRSLFNHVIDLEDTIVELDNDVVEDTHQFRHVINCRYLNSNTHCYGICRMMDAELDRVFGAIGIFDCVEKPGPFRPGEDLLSTGYTVVNNDNEILVNKHKLQEKFLDDTELQSRICQKYNMELVKEKFGELPGLAPIIFTDEDTGVSAIEKGCNIAGIEKEYDNKSNRLDEDIIGKIGDEFEKRLRKVLDEYFRNGK